MILRGGKTTNYDVASIQQACTDLEKADLPPRVMVDCSHANSLKQHDKQKYVGADICKQLSSGEERIFGIMIESNIVEGRQNVVDGKAETYGQSVTDACINWADTEQLLEQFAKAVQARRQAKDTAAA